MKPFAVIRYTDDRLYDFHYRARVARDNGDCIVYLQYNEEVKANPELDAKQVTFWFNGEQEALKFLETVQGMFPQNMYVLVKSVCVSYCEPGPAIVANFTEQGLVPNAI